HLIVAAAVARWMPAASPVENGIPIRCYLELVAELVRPASPYNAGRSWCRTGALEIVRSLEGAAHPGPGDGYGAVGPVARTEGAGHADAVYPLKAESIRRGLLRRVLDQRRRTGNARLAGRFAGVEVEPLGVR